MKRCSAESNNMDHHALMIYHGFIMVISRTYSLNGYKDKKRGIVVDVNSKNSLFNQFPMALIHMFLVLHFILMMTHTSHEIKKLKCYSTAKLIFRQCLQKYDQICSHRSDDL